jgi:hypothetical protein
MGQTIGSGGHFPELRFRRANGGGLAAKSGCIGSTCNPQIPLHRLDPQSSAANLSRCQIDMHQKCLQHRCFLKPRPELERYWDVSVGVTSIVAFARCCSIAHNSSIGHAASRFASTRLTCTGNPTPLVSTASAARRRVRPGNLGLRMISTRVLSASSLKDRAMSCTSRAVATATSRRGRPGPPSCPGWKLAEVACCGMPGSGRANYRPHHPSMVPPTRRRWLRLSVLHSISTTNPSAAAITIHRWYRCTICPGV